MDNEISKMEQILSILREKNKQMDNLMVFTKEMENAIEANDLETLGTVLSIRQESMDKVDRLPDELRGIIEAASQPFRERVKELLEPADERIDFGDPLETAISDTNRLVFMMLKKIMALDEAINKKMKQGAPE